MTHKIPHDWQELALDTVAKRGSGHTPNKKKPEYWNGDIKWISLKDSDRLDNLYILDTVEKITPAGIANSSAVLHPAGTVVLSRDAGVGKSAITKEAMAVSQHFMAWQCGANLNNHFLYHWLQSEKHEFERIAVGSTIKTIGLPYFKHLKIALPPLLEQERIVEVLETWDKAIKKLERKIDLKKKVKKRLLQSLLSGKVRLPTFDKPWETVALEDIFERIRRTSENIDSIKSYSISSKIGFETQEEKYSRVMSGSSLKKYTHILKGEFAYNKGNSLTYPYGCIYVFENVEGLVPFVYITFKNKGKVDSDFYKQYFLHGLLEKQLKALITSGVRGNGLLNIAVEDFFQCKVPCPSIKEQKAIAKTLSTADKHATLLESSLAKLKQQKAYLLNQLISGRIRTPETMPIPKS
jgi:type I restriction enzyme S subunit